MYKILVLLAATAALAWSFLKKPGDAHYFSTKEAVFDVRILSDKAPLLKGTARLHYGGTASYGGIEYHKIAFVFEPQLGLPTEYLFTRLTEKGIYARTMVLRDGTVEYPLLQFPLKPHLHWDDRINGYVRDNTLEHISTYHAPTKAYRHCAHIRSRAKNGRYIEERTAVYAPDVGLLEMNFSGYGRTVKIIRRAE